MTFKPPRVRVVDKGAGPRIPELVVTSDLRDQRFEAPAQTVVDFRGINATNVDFSNNNFQMFLASSSVFLKCDFSRARFEHGNLGNDPKTVYRGCRFDNSDLRNANPLLARFEDCFFDGANLRGLRSYYAEFVSCHFAGRIEGAKFFGRPEGLTGPPSDLNRTVNEFRGNDFREATIVDTSFMHGIDIAAQRWPDGPEYIVLDRIHERIRKARGEAAHWPNPRARRDAEVMLKIYEADCQCQDGLFARRDDMPISPAVTDSVWQLLSSA